MTEDELGGIKYRLQRIIGLTINPEPHTLGKIARIAEDAILALANASYNEPEKVLENIRVGGSASAGAPVFLTQDGKITCSASGPCVGFISRMRGLGLVDVLLYSRQTAMDLRGMYA
jgi:hypothetical protein